MHTCTVTYIIAYLHPIYLTKILCLNISTIISKNYCVICLAKLRQFLENKLRVTKN